MTDFYLEDAEQLIPSNLQGIGPAEIEAAHEFLGRDTVRYQVDWTPILLDVYRLRLPRRLHLIRLVKVKRT